MDHHRSHNPNASHQNHRSASKRERDDSDRGHGLSKSFRHNHHQQQQQWRQDQPGAASGQNSLSSRSLGTRREHYERDFPVYKQPVEVGCFSLDSERRFFNDSRQMRYYIEPDRNPNFDLRDGYRDRFVKRDDGVKEKLDHMLRWVLANRSKLRSKATTAPPG